ncbi:MAG: hypothetical protein ACUVTX_12435 [Bacteroidales bacterium]
MKSLILIIIILSLAIGQERVKNSNSGDRKVAEKEAVTSVQVRIIIPPRHNINNSAIKPDSSSKK